MATWLCRIMLFVFTFQLFAPQIAQAGDTYRQVQQGIAAGKDAAFANKLRELNQEYNTWRQNLLTNGQFDLNDPEDAETFHTFFEAPEQKRQQMLKILWFDRIFLDGRHAKLWENYHSPVLNIHRLRDKDVCKLYSNITDLHVESSWLKQVESKIQQKEFNRNFINAYNAERMGQVEAMKKFQQQAFASSPHTTNFLTNVNFIMNVENGTITLDELLDALDPWQSTSVNLKNLATAGEILGNSLDTWEQELAANRQTAAQAEEEEWNEEMFWQATDEFLLKLQLRAMYRLNQLKPISYTKSDVANIEATGTILILLQKIRNFYNRQNRQNPLESKRYSCEGTPALDNSASGPYSENAVSNVFYTQVMRFANTSFTTEDTEYQRFLLILDYAVAFEVARGFMGNIEEYVKLLDAPLSRNKYEQRLSPALEVLFLTWYENVRYNNNQKNFSGEEVFNAFSQFADYKGSYALPTRIFALEIIGNLIRIQDEDPLRKHIQENPVFQSLLRRQSYNNYTISDQLRMYYSRFVADFYCPLVSTNSYKMEDYGLDSSQMQLLANKLAWIYNNFYDITTPQISMPGSPSRAPTASCAITTKTPLNPLKQKKEMDNAILSFTAEAVFWVFGGEVFSLVGRAFRIARAATMSLPRAIKASAMANRGRRALAFSVEVQKSARMANLSQNLTRNGIQVVATRVTNPVAERGLVSNAAAGAGKSTATETLRLTSNPALRNQYAWRNPRRWVGKQPGQVVEYQVIQPTPGFGVNVGRVSGTKLPNGIRSYRDFKIFSNNLFDATGRSMQLKTYSFADQQLLQSEALMLRSVEKMGKNGAFDLWIPQAEGNYVRFRSFASAEEAKPFLTAYMANPTEELLLTSFSAKAPAAASTLSGIPGVRVTLPDILSGFWKNKAAQELYTPLDWGGTVSNLLMPRYIPKHMSLWEAPGSMLAATFNSSSFVRGLKGTTTFFLGMELTDQALYPSFKHWVASTEESETNKLLLPYAHIQNPQFLQEEEQAQQEMLSDLEEQGFNTTPVNAMYDEVIAAANPEKAGTTLTFPLVAGWHYSSKAGFWSSPFQREGDRIQLDMQARRLERNRLVRHYQQAKERREFTQFFQALRQQQAELPFFFAWLRQEFSVNWDAEETAFNEVYRNYIAEIQEISQVENNREKNKKIESTVKKYKNEIQKLNKRIDNRAKSGTDPKGEKAFFRSQIENFETELEEFDLRLIIPSWRERYPERANGFIREYSQLLSELIEQIKSISKEKGAFLDKYAKFITKKDSFKNKQFQLLEKYRVNQSSGEESTPIAAINYGDMLPQE